MLGKIKKEELLFLDNLGASQTNTKCFLDDYDWIHYKLETAFLTENYGSLTISFEYYGCTHSSMKVTQVKDGVTTEYGYEYSTEIFQRYLKKFLEAHMKQWESGKCFNGEEIVLDFYNEVIKDWDLKIEEIGF